MRVVGFILDPAVIRAPRNRNDGFNGADNEDPDRRPEVMSLQTGRRKRGPVTFRPRLLTGLALSRTKYSLEIGDRE